MARVMVVEDEQLVKRDIMKALRLIGHEVSAVAATGKDAVEQALIHRPELILMDIRLRGEMDGIQAASKIHEQVHVPIIFLTAYADADSVARTELVEPHRYVLKPYEGKELGSAIEVALYKHGIECQLRDRERWFSTALRSIGDGVIATDERERISFMNPIAASLTGWSNEDAIGHPISDVIRLVREDTRAPVDCPTRRAVKEHAVIGLQGSVLLVSRDGKPIPVDDSAAPIVDGDGQLLGAVLVLHDIRNRRELETRLAVSDRLAALGTMTAGIAHEINNPLTYNVANLAYVLGEFPRHLESIKLAIGPANPAWPGIAGKCEELQAALRDAQEGAERVRHIVADMKTFSRPQDDCSQLLELPQILDAAIRMSLNEIQHHARFVKDLRSAPLVRGNGGQLGQVFVNLLGNAAQAISEIGAEGQEIRLLLDTSADGYAVVEISDTGDGIAPDSLARIFDPFFTTKAVGVGTGLGLSICHSILTAHGGNITARSELGKGTTFHVRLPPAEWRTPSENPVAA